MPEAHNRSERKATNSQLSRDGTLSLRTSHSWRIRFKTSSIFCCGCIGLHPQNKVGSTSVERFPVLTDADMEPTDKPVPIFPDPLNLNPSRARIGDYSEHLDTEVIKTRYASGHLDFDIQLGGLDQLRPYGVNPSGQHLSHLVGSNLELLFSGRHGSATY